LGYVNECLRVTGKEKVDRLHPDLEALMTLERLGGSMPSRIL
jgi:hypothetical protein